MPQRFDTPNDAHFLTFSCYRRLALFSSAAIRDAFADHLEACRTRHGFELRVWVIMPEHVHLVVVPRGGEPSMAALLRSLKEPFARLVLKRWRELDAAILKRVADPRGQHRFWQRGGGYDRNIRSRDELLEKIRYIHENPVRRGVVDRAGDWRWSSAWTGTEERGSR